MSENGMHYIYIYIHVYTRTPWLRIKLFFHNTQIWRECIIIIKNAAENILLNKKTRDYYERIYDIINIDTSV